MSDLANLQQNGSCDVYDLSCHMRGISDFFSSFFQWVFEKILGAFASVIELIPVPEFFNSFSSAKLPSVVLWAAEPFMLSYGVGIISTAYIVRFVIRRLPIVG